MSQKEIKSPAGPPPSSSRWYRHVAHTHTYTHPDTRTRGHTRPWTRSGRSDQQWARSQDPRQRLPSLPRASTAVLFCTHAPPGPPFRPSQGGRQRRGTCARPRRFSGVSSRQASSDRRRRRRSGRPRTQRRETRVTAPPARVAGLPRGKGSVARLAWTAPDASGFPSASSPGSECCELHSALSSSSAPFIILRPVVFWCFSAHFPPSWSG